MKIGRYFLAGLLVICAAPAFAGTACYAPEQRQAEQWLRLHTEMMFITVTCRQGSDGQALPDIYVSFTRKNLPALQKAEQTMTDYYQATANGDPVANLDRMRTLLSNEFGQKAAKMTAPEFCAVYRDKVAQTEALTPAALDDQIQRMMATEPSYAKPCNHAVGTKKGG
jgi:hypothetical protein